MILSDGYALPGGVYDETRDGSKLRPHWRFLMRSLETLGLEELNRRSLEADRLLRESGVTYNVYAEQSDRRRRWKLDPIPLLIESSEWNDIEQGLMQRAELLDLILRDLYGPRDLLRKGLLPPEVVYSHPGFLRPCVDPTQPPDRGFLTLANDLARDRDGNFVVMADRAQAPSGSGYALENRIVLSRALPSLYRDSQVHRLAVYFRALRNTLAALAPRNRDDPRVVILTPGPGNETYFEHAYLASYLGYILTEGNDLTVRDGRVYIQTVGGQMDEVDVILRRLDDTYCDPLELKPDSLLGTPGLLQAMRLGNVAVVNPPGSGVLDNPALLPFLPALCKHLLGQDLRIPSVQTYWCGDPKHREHVIANIDQMIIKPLAPQPGGRSILGDRLNGNERSRLIDRIRSRPHGFVGQEPLPLSTLPCLHSGDGRRFLEARPMILRTFLLARDHEFVLMPGGLTRVSDRTDSPLVSNQRGGVSKDTWVVASEPLREVTLLHSTDSTVANINRGGGEVASRVADNLFWIGRYIERADGMTRLLREILPIALEAQPSGGETLNTLLYSLTHLTSNYPGFLVDDLRAQPEEELSALIFDRSRSGSLAFNLHRALSCGRSVRDRLSEDGWRILNTMHEHFEQQRDLGTALASLENLAIWLAAFAGVTNETMNHGIGWRFLDMGRRTERTLATLSILRQVFSVPPPRNDVLLETLLFLKDSLRIHRRRYRSRMDEASTLDTLLLDESHPQSVGYQLAALAEHASRLPRPPESAQRSREERLTIEALAKLRLAEAEALAASPDEREELLRRLSELTLSFSDSLTESYLVHGIFPQQVIA